MKGVWQPYDGCVVLLCVCEKGERGGGKQAQYKENADMQITAACR